MLRELFKITLKQTRKVFTEGRFWIGQNDSCWKLPLSKSQNSNQFEAHLKKCSGKECFFENRECHTRKWEREKENEFH